MRRLAFSLMLSMVASGCSTATTIELIVEGDLEPGIHVDELSLAMWDDGAQTWSANQVLSAASGLPLVYTLEPPPRGGLSSELTVDAIRQEQRILEVRRAISFVSGESVQVRVCLWAACLGSTLPDCLEGRCDSPETDGDADADADADSDAAADADTDTAADADAHSLVDADDDSEVDSENDSDLPTDADVGADAPSDAGTDARGDVGPDADVDGGVDGGAEAGADADLDAAADADTPDDGGVDELVPGEWTTIPGGTFNMGAMPEELGSEDDETLHRVVLSRDFRLQTTEVSGNEFALVMGYVPPLHSGCAECPVADVTWNEAAVYCNELSLLAGLELCYSCTGAAETLQCQQRADLASPYECAGYRLPTESEWERAARAGTTGATYNGELDNELCASAVLDPIAWYCGTSSDESHPCGTLLPNDYGLYDMLGNVSEWCHDYYDIYPTGPVDDPWGPEEGSARAHRGGSMYDFATAVRAASREFDIPDGFGWTRGFRPARTLIP